MPRRSAFLVTLLASAAVDVTVASAQSRPLPVESVNGPGAGNVTLAIGFDVAHDVRYTLSGLEGDLWRVGLIRVDVGLSAIADFELSGGLRDHLAITSQQPAVLSDLLRLSNPSATGAFDDAVVGTKVRLTAEDAERPGISIRFATRLPNAKHPSGLGQNSMDFYSSLIIEKSYANTSVIANIGWGSLGDPLRGNRHVASLLYSVAAQRPVSRAVAIVAGVDGRTGPLESGLEARAIGRSGLRWHRAAIQIDAAATYGLTPRDGTIGAALTAAYTFHAFVP